MKKLALLSLLAVTSLLLTFFIAEVAWRVLLRPEAQMEMHYRDGDGRRLAVDGDGNLEPAGLAKIFYLLDGSVGLPNGETPVPIPPAKRPQPPHAFRPGAHFHICYSGPQRPYFDENGCVEYRFNSVGLREEADITYEPKPEGQYRILCQGDSFTLGWGVQAEDNWTTLLEKDLQRDHPLVRTVNTGMAGQSYADEYWYALRDRLHRLQPDMVLVSLCLNDLIITNAKLGHVRPESLVDEARGEEDLAWWENSSILRDLSRGLSDPFDLDPDVDHVQLLLGLDGDHPYYTTKGESPELYWASGTPQNALRSMRDWCRERELPFGVVLWPLFQNLEHGDDYPFASLHKMVGQFCARESIPFLDLLPPFRGEPAETLWVSPIDMHGNARAMALASPSIAAFARTLGDF